MRILTRYVLIDLILLFLLTVGALTAMIFLSMAGKEAVDNGVGLGPVLRMAPYLLPQALPYAVPGAMLLATTSVFGRMSANNEVVALKSAGVSPWAIAWPAMALAAMVSLAAVVLNDIAYSWGRLGVERVVAESVEEIVYGQLRTRRAFSSGRLSINVQAVEGRRLIEPIVKFSGDSEESGWVCNADWAEIESRPAEQQVVLRFKNIGIDGRTRIVAPDLVERLVPLDIFLGGSREHRNPTTYALAEIDEAIAETQSDQLHAQQAMAAQAVTALLTGDFGRVSEPEWGPALRKREAAEDTLHRLHTEPYRRWASGFSCLGFVMVGVPVAIWFRKGDFLTSFFICFAPILILYYPMLIVSVKEAKNGGLPPASIWVGNVMLALAGIYLMRKVTRY